ncbi:MAG: hypothetical protein CMJ83_11565 [Planctomycetes bacterium]|nr:hypothetical protein [Planctomycetota bacterium]
MRILSIAALLVTTLALPAQELVRLQDGTTVQAKKKRRGKSIVLVTVFGQRSVPKAALADQQPTRDERKQLEQAYRAQLAQVPTGFHKGRVAVARWCVGKGLLVAAKEQLKKVFRVDPDFQPAHDLCAELAQTWAFDDNETAKKARDRRKFAKTLFAKYAARDLVTAVLAYHKAKNMDKRSVFRPALKGLKNQRAGVRWASARTLATYRDRPERINPLYKRSLLDPAAAVRKEAVRSLGVTKDPVFATLFARNLFNPKQVIRLTAAEALAELGMDEGVLPLIGALRNGGAGGVRAHISILTQKAYVKDFDVEIAQAAVIADPVVDTVTEGVVLDVTVVGTSAERGTYRRALRSLTGRDFGTDWRAWEKWWKTRQKSTQR